uniref:Uncharacterized protein n=2 Tax=Brassica oleracea TaxID=3712 RepID=A0A0D3A2E0_BRAOL|nr:unnamed protein product [Brassica oleracea]
MFSLGMVHIDLEETHGSILLPRSQQQRFCISLSRMRYGEGMVVVKEVMEAVIWFRGLTNLSLSHLCTASSLCEKTRSDAASYMRSLPMWLLKAEAKLVMAKGIKVVKLEIVVPKIGIEKWNKKLRHGKHTLISLGAPRAKAFVAQTCAVIFFVIQWLIGYMTVVST